MVRYVVFTAGGEEAYIGTLLVCDLCLDFLRVCVCVCVCVAVCRCHLLHEGLLSLLVEVRMREDIVRSLLVLCGQFRGKCTQRRGSKCN